MTTIGHRYELHRANTHKTDEQGRRYRWCIYDYFNVNGQKGLSFWYFATKQDALTKYPEASNWKNRDKILPRMRAYGRRHYAANRERIRRENDARRLTERKRLREQAKHCAICKVALVKLHFGQPRVVIESTQGGILRRRK